MTNHERAENQLQTAASIAGETRAALERGEWNLALRRAQEVVELSPKALILITGSDYPRKHDAAQGFAYVVRERGLQVDDETLSEIAELSQMLARKRAPALYREIVVTEAEARRAARGADKVLDLARRLWDDLTLHDDET